MVTALAAALDRFAGWRDGLDDGAVVDAASGLTAADLDILLCHLAATRDVVMIRYLDLHDLPPALLALADKNGPTSIGANSGARAHGRHESAYFPA